MSGVDPPVALTIAGSDSSGGAGIQADLATFAAHGVHGTSAITAVTAQNTEGVHGVSHLPVEFVAAQMDAVLTDLGVDAVKTGMLGSAAVIELVAETARRGALPNLVVDPVLVATSGDRLLDSGSERSYLDLLREAQVITPNLWEAGVLLGRDLATVDDIRRAAAELAGLCPGYVVVTGGHLVGAAIDVVIHGQDLRELPAARIATSNNHGSGCTFASAVAARLARGVDVDEAVDGAKEFVRCRLRRSAAWQLGRGNGPVAHLCPDDWGDEGRSLGLRSNS
ncbi:MAG: Pyridoxine kinase [Acidimicrobiales bacterium]|nr:MAG: bifunctional hydroxymethylpyrimidine kinase/phosphomethylpyrimidine kinase [Actinomycetota bacterium]MBV6508139.1 Pyridoxine kinase [Acidimicrobiales bacterium]RIK03884.1 MAG: bifunctional hydroxymethylpyrimidine kinase/phosphomethylpyrimidine kinase [Acidobacteriota bacterium]